MSWFTRKGRSEDPARGNARPGPGSSDPVEADGPVEVPLRPVIERVGVEEQERIARGRAGLAAAGVDSADLDALGAAFDAALSGWLDASTGQRGDERELVEQFAIGIGDHLASHTDLRWARVTDAFGTDLAVAGGRDEFVVVPGNLVAARWMNADRGWVPGVVTHLVRVRASR